MDCFWLPWIALDIRCFETSRLRVIGILIVVAVKLIINIYIYIGAWFSEIACRSRKMFPVDPQRFLVYHAHPTHPPYDKCRISGPHRSGPYPHITTRHHPTHPTREVPEFRTPSVGPLPPHHHPPHTPTHLTREITP